MSHNVAAKTERIRRAETGQATWTADEMLRFLDATLSTGMRRGELAGLRWQDISLNTGELTVAVARVAVGYQVVDSGPKTLSGKRTIALDEGVVDALKSHQTRQGAERLTWGPAQVDSGLVFTREDGTGLHPQYITWAFRNAAEKAAVPVLGPHAAARLGHATAGLRVGIDLVTMSKRLGHSSTAITSDIYQHAVKELDQDAARQTGDLLLRPDKPAADLG